MIKPLLQWTKDNPGVAAAIWPVILTGVFAALASTKEMYMAYITGSDWGKSSYAIEQKRLWEINMPCVQNTQFELVLNNHNVEIGTIVCPTGDVLISAKGPTADHPSFKWVSWNEVTPTPSTAFKFKLFNEAHAQQVMCQMMTPNGYIRKRIQYYDGTCWDLTVNPYTGQVVHSIQVDCRRGCS
jgi:hypothetical protein